MLKEEAVKDKFAEKTKVVRMWLGQESAIAYSAYIPPLACDK